MVTSSIGPKLLFLGKITIQNTKWSIWFVCLKKYIDDDLEDLEDHNFIDIFLFEYV